MKINTSQISMDASAEHKDVTGKFGTIRRGKREGDPEFQLKLPGMAGFARERVTENRQGQELCAASNVRCPESEESYETNADQVIERMVSEISGQRVRMRRISGLGNGDTIHLTKPLNPPGRQVGFSFVSQQTHFEYERVSVCSSGSVTLEDGREIDFSLQLNMERESFIRDSMSMRGSNILMDPLTLNFDCDLRSLVNRSFQFDMDCDGTLDEFCSLAPGSGFLALDLNNDQHVNDGSELFGPTTGYGFSELAKHDMDMNGWIDENDPIFSKLQIWQPGADEEGNLLTLAEAGVGAICLSHDTNSFQLKDMDNHLMGEVAATGLYLTENGEVRTMQEIKLALQGGDENPESVSAGQRELDAQFFLRQLIVLRQEEVRSLAKNRLVDRKEKNENDLLAGLFPDWQKEKGLPSVEQRRKDSLLS
jgi:hypothetical protein